MVIYLRHPVHGTKVASTDVEAAHDRENGWVDFTPEGAAPAAPEAPVVEDDQPDSELDDAADQAAPPETPSVVENPEVPAFLAPPPATEVVSDLPADFPGRKALIDGGLPMWADLIDKSVDELVALKGIGAATAEAIVKAMNS